MVDRFSDNNENVRFCPLLTIVKAGQANYMVCQSNCIFFLDEECAFITSAKALKGIIKGDNTNHKSKSEK